MRLTIITPTSENSPSLQVTLNSVIEQEYPQLEYWVIADLPIEESFDLQSRFKGPINWLTEKNRGLAEAVNRGFEQAHGEIIGWINSPDSYAPEAFQSVADAFDQNPETDFIYGDFRLCDESKQVLKTCRTGSLNQRQLIRLGAARLHPPVVFFKRRLLQRVGGCDTTLKHGIDYDLWCRMVQIAQPLHLSRILADCHPRYEENDATAEDQIQNEYKAIRQRYTKSFTDRSWCWYDDKRSQIANGTQLSFHRSPLGRI